MGTLIASFCRNSAKNQIWIVCILLCHPVYPSWRTLRTKKKIRTICIYLSTCDVIIKLIADKKIKFSWSNMFIAGTLIWICLITILLYYTLDFLKSCIKPWENCPPGKSDLGAKIQVITEIDTCLCCWICVTLHVELWPFGSKIQIIRSDKILIEFSRQII